MAECKLYTIGHSTHTLEDFIGLLKLHGVSHLVDVRTIPKSRRVPWFNGESLAASLAAENILYTHMIRLGGLRKPANVSINAGWRNASFRGYADYMLTPAFEMALRALLELADSPGCSAIMCAEAVPWRCHRSLISDVLTVRGFKVCHIINKKAPHTHKLTSFVKIDKSKVPYRVFYP